MLVQITLLVCDGKIDDTARKGKSAGPSSRVGDRGEDPGQGWP